MNVRRRLLRRRQCDVLPLFQTLLAAEPEAAERWGQAPLRTRKIYVNWMAASWRSKTRHARVTETLGYLLDDSLDTHIQHPTWGDALPL